MAATVIELNDVGVTASAGEGLLVDSPGYAVLDGDELVVGKRAYETARIKPRWTNNKYWARLSLDGMPGATRRYRSHADLAHAHLSAVWGAVRDDTESVILAVPATFDRDQLGLLLGIAQELEIPVAGMVDASLAAAVTVDPGTPILHLDIQLHRVVLCLFDQSDQIRRSGVFVIADEGLSALRDVWVGVIEDAFVRNTRFDPMHVAATEQVLYDRLAEWLDALQDNDSITVELETGGRNHSVVIKIDQLAQANANIYPQIVQHVRGRTRSGGDFRLLLSNRLNAFPGLGDTLRMLAGCEVVHLDADAVARGAMAHADAIAPGDGALTYVTSLPWQKSDADPGTEPVSNTAAPTHLLHDAQAFPINEIPFVIGSSIPHDARGINLNSTTQGISRRHCSVFLKDGRVHVEDHSSYGTYVNGRKVEGSSVAGLGDRVGVGAPGDDFRFIQLVNDDGS